MESFRDLLPQSEERRIMLKFDLSLALAVLVLLFALVGGMTACSDTTAPNKVQPKQDLTYLVTASFDSPRQYGPGNNWSVSLGNGIDTTSSSFIYWTTGESIGSSPATMVLTPGKTAQLLFYSNDGALGIPMGGTVGATYSMFVDWPASGSSSVQIDPALNLILSKQDQQYVNGVWTQVQFANHVFSLSGNRGTASISFPRDPSRYDAAYGSAIRLIHCDGDGTAHLSGASMTYTIAGPYSYSTMNTVPPITLKCTGYASAAAANAALQAINARLP